MYIEFRHGTLATTRMPRKRIAIATAALLVFATIGNASADDYLEPLGGPGGGRFEAHCPTGQLLVGFDLRVGDDVDAIRPLCAVVYGPREADAAMPASGWFGGTGGGPSSIVCPTYTPVVIGMYVRAEGQATSVVNNIHLFCGMGSGTQSVSGVPSAVFDGPNHNTSGLMTGFSTAPISERQNCPAGQVAVGMHGRSGIWVDAIGLICTALAPDPNVVSSIGKVGPTSPPGPRRPICEAARDARARSSPAAPNLEAQCEASKTVVTSIGKQGGGGSTRPQPRRTICEAARDARARNSPAAPNLEAQCRASQSPTSSIGTATPAPANSLPANTPSPADTMPATPPQPPAPTTPTKRETRDAALQALIGTVVSTIQQSREDTNEGRARDSASNRVDESSDRRRGDSLPHEAQATTHLQQYESPYQLAQPDGSIRIQVSYPATYGYKDAAGLFDPGPNSCGAFYISTLPVADVRPREPTRIDTQPRMREADGVYACDYLIHDQPISTPVVVRVAMSDQRAASSAAWLGGSQPQPPAGQRRTIVDGDRQVVLTADRPSAALRFEMTYAGSR